MYRNHRADESVRFGMSKALICIGIVSVVAGVSQAQPLSVGIKGGIPFTDAVDGSGGVHSEEKRYTVGPMVEVSLPFSFAIEVDALYKRTGYSTIGGAFGLTTLQRIRANSWEFPLLGKFYFPGHFLPWRPYVEVGYVGRRAFGTEGTFSTFGRDVIGGNQINSSGQLSTSFLIRDNPTNGVAVGGGVRLKLGPLRIAPGVRYTHWGGKLFDQEGSQGFFVRSTQNQAEFLVGLSF